MSDPGCRQMAGLEKTELTLPDLQTRARNRAIEVTSQVCHLRVSVYAFSPLTLFPLTLPVRRLLDSARCFVLKHMLKALTE